MLLNTLFKKFTTLAVACLIVSPAIGQETNVSPQEPTDITTLTADGHLNGSVATTNADKIAQVPSAKVSLVSKGKVIDSVTADANGQFSFANVHPGPYQVVGTAAGLVGSQAFQVSPFTDSQPSVSRQLLLQQPSTVSSYHTFSHSPLSTVSSPTIGYAGGGGRAIGGRAIGGRLGGRLLGGNGGGIFSSPLGLLVVGGIVGGVVSISDSSPDQ